MTNLGTLLDRPKARQRDIIMEAAKHDMPPPDGMLKQIAELENAITAVEAIVDEEAEHKL